MPDKRVPRSHGSFGHAEEFGNEFNPEDLKNEKQIQISKKGFGSKLKKMKDKAMEVARQNLE